MYGIEVLKEEHGNILRFTDVLEKECVEILEGKEVDTDYFRRAIDFIRRYADGHHHQKEEDVLFVVMEKELGDVAVKLIRHGMLVEHDMARFTVMELEKALDAYDKNPGSLEKLNILAHGMAYVGLLRRHADKENRVLYPFGEKNLSDEAKEWVDQETKKLEDKAEEEGFFQGFPDFL